MPSYLKKYKAENLQDQYDAIVIGSGIGGMACAAFLADSGQRVLVLEQHYTPGGFTHMFRRGDWAWDTGVHYIGEVHRKNAMLRMIFDEISGDALQWEWMGEEYDRAIYPDASYSFMAGRKAFLGAMGDRFPGEREGLARYVDMVHDVSRASRDYYAGKPLPPGFATGPEGPPGAAFRAYAARTVGEVLTELIGDERLRGVLASQWGDYGLPPGKASFAMHAQVVKHYMDGGNYPVGGAGRIAATILPRIVVRGGDVRVRAKVDRVLLHREKAVGVVMADGHEIRADRVISNAGVIRTWQRLLRDAPEHLRPGAGQWPDAVASSGHLCVYLGLDISDTESGVSRCNQWIMPGYDHDRNVAAFARDPQADFPCVYVSFPSAKDPLFQENHPGKSTVELITMMGFNHVRTWEKTGWYQRGDGYVRFKEELADRLQEVACRHNPGLKGHIARREISTPLSTRHFSGYSQGEIYGIDHTPRRLLADWLRPATPVGGLFLTGQDVATAGIGGALIGGVLTASTILGRNLMQDVLIRRKKESGV